MSVDGRNVVADVHAVLDRIEDFSNRVRSGSFKGCTGKPLRNVISIGIGACDSGNEERSISVLTNGLLMRFCLQG